VLGAMSNVLAMNVSYDVSVKMLAGHLLLMSMILLIPDIGRLTRIFVLNRGSLPTALPAFVDVPRRARALGIVTGLYATYAIGTIVWGNVTLGSNAHSGTPSALTGVYDVESFARNGSAITDARDSTRWDRVAIEATGFTTIRFSGDRSA